MSHPHPFGNPYYAPDNPPDVNGMLDPAGRPWTFVDGRFVSAANVCWGCGSLGKCGVRPGHKDTDFVVPVTCGPPITPLTAFFRPTATASSATQSLLLTNTAPFPTSPRYTANVFGMLQCRFLSDFGLSTMNFGGPVPFGLYPGTCAGYDGLSTWHYTMASAGFWGPPGTLVTVVLH